MIKRLHENHLIAQVVRYGSTVETAGQVATNTAASLEEQSIEVLGKVTGLLEEVGATLNDLVRVQVWLTNIAEFETFNAVYEKWLDGRPKPVRACAESALVAGGYVVEVQAFAYVAE
ncbi:RidA family protein [Pseudomonas tolaasii]|uniref:RidA family protein n=1 Tax=Pseudomonas tolaasii TaxID=29442 RepID=UPI0015A08B31|nr:RidA family protein [Pseudomonas tolaasii]NVZ45473.1 RidA family protein [Pseudomonas tolaasii]NWA48547.1 RidA family protein [Pseudomonas tolaasii]